MKKTVLLLSLLIALPALAETVSFGVKGMVCSMCAQGIKKKFSALDITDVSVDLDKKLVTYTSDKVLSDAKINEIIQDAGYAITDIKRK
jgi:periplasmic mercuric ion binding protein